MIDNKPNIVFILADDMGNWAMTNSGNCEVMTPNLDALAEVGIKFDNFFCTSPVCSPSRASILTGCMPSCHGVHDWIRRGNIDKNTAQLHTSVFADERTAVDYLEEMTTYTDLLKENGYRCMLSGKWHLGNSIQPQHGYDEWYTIALGGCDYMHPQIVEDGKIKLANDYITDLITNNAIKNIDNIDSAQPFYLGVHYTAPHSPWGKDNFPSRIWEKYNDIQCSSTPNLAPHPLATKGYTNENRKINLQGFYTAITSMDEGIGKIIKKLEDENLIDNTIIIFTADNGMNMGHHGIWGKGNATYPTNMYEESIKVPFILYYKNKTTKQVAKNLYNHYDIFPTLVDYLNLRGNINQKIVGKSFSCLLDGKNERADEKVVVCFSEYGSSRMIRNNKFKLIERNANEYNEFYDLTNDPDEKRNLYKSESRNIELSAMSNILKTWFDENSIEKNDGRRQKVYGSGQLKLNKDKKAYYKPLTIWQNKKQAKKFLKENGNKNFEMKRNVRSKKNN